MPDRLLVRRGLLALPGGPARADILCAGHQIISIGRDLKSTGVEEFDASGLTLGPGLVDLHVHGGGGHAFFTHEAARIAAYAQWAPRNGVTSFLVSTIGRDADDTASRLQALRPAIGGQPGAAEPLGFHLEGPFINPQRRGAFDSALRRPPDQAELARYQESAGGLIRQVTLAPELPAALDLVAGCRATGAVAAMGHTDATAQQARRGFEAGITHVTHLYNGMRPIHQREGGPIVAALLDQSVTCELICDGAHVAPEVLRLSYGVLGPRRTVVVTDNLHLAGTDAQAGQFAGRPVTVEGPHAVRDDGVIVGSVATMDQHLRNTVSMLGVDLPTAFRLCSTNPSRVAGAARRKGGLDIGMDADIVMLDADLNVAATVCRGRLAYRRK